jgi:hypothetical protein
LSGGDRPLNGMSFTITSSDNTDTSAVAWMLVEPSA